MKYESAVENGATRTLVSTGDNRSTVFVPASVPASKRAMDLLIAIPALLFLSPAMLVIGLLIKVFDGGPIFFIQPRRGAGGEYFFCMKFRTMRTDAAEMLAHILATDPVRAAEWRETQKLTNDPRITGIGHFLRKSSLDELPQLLNIISGEMSIVGPRPIVDSEVERYQDDIAYYDSVLPGVTGLWQVNGRSSTTYAERVAFDREYAETRTLLGDVVILFQTIPAVFLGRGAV
ncbi:MAG: sugar transferase [Pseudomonadota bacterium]